MVQVSKNQRQDNKTDLLKIKIRKFESNKN